MNKEQILQDHVDKEQLDELSEGIWPAILDAMDTYKNQPPKSSGVKEPEEYLKTIMADKRMEKAYTLFGNLSEGGYIPFWAAKEALTAQAKDFEREMEAKILDFSKELTALILTPPFSLGHSQHAIACEKIAELRNRYRSQFMGESNSCPPIRTPTVKLYCVCGCGAIRPGEPCRENGMAFENCPECETPTLCDGVKCIK